MPAARFGASTFQPMADCSRRVYCHHLAVVDDWEFWERQQPFSLGQQRAIAAALNTLVFRTQLPDSGSSSGSGTKPGGGRSASLGLDYRMLQQAAPLLHRRVAAVLVYVAGARLNLPLHCPCPGQQRR